jgi:hypothetical protein
LDGNKGRWNTQTSSLQVSQSRRENKILFIFWSWTAAADLCGMEEAKLNIFPLKPYH